MAQISDLDSSRCVVLLSAGLDSYILWRLLGRPTSVYYDLKVQYSNEELFLINAIKGWFPGNDIAIKDNLSLEEFEDKKTGYVPFRNLFLITQACLDFKDKDTFVIGQTLEWQTDKNERFYRLCEKLCFKLARRKVRIISPLSKWTKTECIKQFLIAGFGQEELKWLTRSCLSKEHIECGKCSSCVNRWIAFKNNSIPVCMSHTPTWKDWKNKIDKSKFKLSNLYMYIIRWFEARKAFHVDTN